MIGKFEIRPYQKRLDWRHWILLHGCIAYGWREKVGSAKFGSTLLAKNRQKSVSANMDISICFDLK